jgi:hypothetical protein
MRNDKESVAYLLHSFPLTTLTTTLDHHYLHSLRVSDPLIHTMGTLQHSYFSGPAVFAQNAPSSLSPELDCLSFPSGPSLPLLAQNSYPTPPHQGLQSLHHIVPLSGPPIGSFPTQSTTHTSIFSNSVYHAYIHLGCIGLVWHRIRGYMRLFIQGAAHQVQQSGIFCS